MATGLFQAANAAEDLVRTALRLEAVAAVDRLRTARAERHLGLAATAGAGRCEHLARGALVAAAARVPATTARVAATTRVTTRRLAGCAASGAATGLAELSIGEELLLARRECELLAAIGTGEHLVCCKHEKTPARAAPANLSRREPVRGVCAAFLTTPSLSVATEHTTRF